MKIERFEDIEAWQLARELNRAVYAVTKSPKFSQDFGLKDQIRDAAGSTMHNTAEGFDSGSNAEFVRFLRYSQRSCTEVQSELYVALDQGYITQEQFDEIYKLAARTRAKTGGFIKYLENNPRPAPRHHEPQTPNEEPRTPNQEPGTKNQEPRTKN